MICNPPLTIGANLELSFPALAAAGLIIGYRGIANEDGTTTVYEWIERNGACPIPTVDQIKAAGG